MSTTRLPLRRALSAALLSWSVASAGAASDAQRWQLSDLYATPAAWDSAGVDLRQRIDALEGLRNHLGQGTGALRETLVTISDTQRAMGRLYVYASLGSDEDLREPRAQERKQQALALWTRLGEKTAWLAPAIQGLGAAQVREAIAADPVLQRRFNHFLNDTLRNAPHTLAADGEALLAATGAVLAQPQNVFDQLADAELPRPTVLLSDGCSVTSMPT